MGVRTALCLALVSSHRLALALLTPHIRSFSCIAHSLGRSSHRTDEHCLIAHQCRSSGGLQCSSRLLHEQAIDSSAILTSIGVAGSLAIIALAALVKLSSSVNSSTGAALYEYNVDPTDKSYIFDESIPRDEFQVPAPMYLISALLSGLNALPVEAALKDGSQRGRRVQYKVLQLLHIYVLRFVTLSYFVCSRIVACFHSGSLSSSARLARSSRR